MIPGHVSVVVLSEYRDFDRVLILQGDDVGNIFFWYLTRFVFHDFCGAAGAAKGIKECIKTLFRTDQKSFLEFFVFFFCVCFCTQKFFAKFLNFFFFFFLHVNFFARTKIVFC